MKTVSLLPSSEGISEPTSSLSSAGCGACVGAAGVNSGVATGAGGGVRFGVGASGGAGIGAGADAGAGATGAGMAGAVAAIGTGADPWGAEAWLKPTFCRYGCSSAVFTGAQGVPQLAQKTFPAMTTLSFSSQSGHCRIPTLSYCLIMSPTTVSVKR